MLSGASLSALRAFIYLSQRAPAVISPRPWPTASLA